MLIYSLPDSPESWLGREDFWIIGGRADVPIARKLTGALFGVLLFPMSTKEGVATPVRPAEIGLQICSRLDLGASDTIPPAGGFSHSRERTIHEHQFGPTINPSAALIQAASVLRVVRDMSLIEDLCNKPSSKPVQEIAPAFARALGSLIVP